MTRESYLAVLGLGSNATWEQVQSAYARLLEHHLAEQGKGNDDDKNALQELEDAFAFLLRDPVIQARRDLPVRSATPPPAAAKVPVPTHAPSASTSAGERAAILALITSCIVLLLGAMAFLSTNYLNSRENSGKALRAEFHSELTALRRQSSSLSQQLELLDLELGHLRSQHRKLSKENGASKKLSKSKPKETGIGATKNQESAPRPGKLPVPDIDVLTLRTFEGKTPAAYTERDKMYVLQHDGSVVEGYTAITPPLIDASIRCDAKLAKSLLSDGTNINQFDSRGDSALAWAVKRDCVSVTRVLLYAGVEVNSTSRNGFSPYLWAKLYRNERMQNLLKAAGADTQLGSYWWRFDEDGQKAYLDRALEAACRNPYAEGCQN